MDLDDSKEARLEEMRKLDEFIIDMEKGFTKTLATLNWTKEGLYKAQNSGVQASVPEHRASDAMQDYYLLSSQKKLEIYKESLRPTPNTGHSVSLEVADVSTSKSKTTFTDIHKLKRDLKRRRMKYRTTKAPPLAYIEELRELINLQMEILSNKS